MHASISHARCSQGCPAPGGRGPSPHCFGTGSGRNLPRVSRGDRSVRRRLPALVGRQRISDPCFILIADCLNKAPQALGTRTSAASLFPPSILDPKPPGRARWGDSLNGCGMADDKLRTGPGKPLYAFEIRTLHARFSQKVIENAIACQIWRQTGFGGCGERKHPRVLLWARGIPENSPSCSVRIGQPESTSSHLGTGFASMQLAYSFLADAAEVNPPSGRYFVFNGGVETITCLGLPSVIPTLKLHILRTSLR